MRINLGGLGLIPGLIPGLIGALIIALAGAQDAAAQAAHPAWSPDGERLAYQRHDLDAGTADIFILDLTRGEAEVAATGMAWSVSPAWSPDGPSIVFAGAEGGLSDNWDIVRLDLESGAVERLVAGPGREAQPVLSPDGSRLVFGRMGGDFDLFLLDLDSGEERVLVQTPEREFHAKWRGDGAALFFDRETPEGGSQILELDLASGEEIVRAGSAAAFRRVGQPAPYGETGYMYGNNFAATGTWSAYDGNYRSWSPEGARVLSSAQRPGAPHEIAITLDAGQGAYIVLYDVETNSARVIAQ